MQISSPHKGRVVNLLLWKVKWTSRERERVRATTVEKTETWRQNRASSQVNAIYYLRRAFLCLLWLKHQSRCQRCPLACCGEIYLFSHRVCSIAHFASSRSSFRLWFIWLFLGDGSKSSPLNTNWTSPKHQTNDKRKPLDDSYAGVSWPFCISLKSLHYSYFIFGDAKQNICTERYKSISTLIKFLLMMNLSQRNAV